MGKKNKMGNIKNQAFVVFVLFILVFFNSCRGDGKTDKDKHSVLSTLYASPDGNGNQFSKRHPGSLKGVRDKVRSMNMSMTGNIVINLRGGIYFQKSALTLKAEDSGNNGYSVIWQASPGEKPVLSGGKTISEWVLSDRERNIYKTNVGDLKFRQLYVNGKRAIRARTPNMTDELDKGPYSRILSWNNFHPAIPALLVSGTSNTGMTEFCVNMYWQHFRYRIDSFTLKGDSAFLSFRMPEAETAPITVDKRAPFILENAIEFLDAEGEWFLDSTTGNLFYKPRQGEKMSEVQVIAPVLETIMKIEGDSTFHAHDIRFKGLSFAHSTWTVPDNLGYTCLQAAFIMNIPGIVEVSNANHVVFDRNYFSHAGGFGLVFSAFSNQNTITGNVITDISANGIVLDPVYTRNNDTTQINVLSSMMTAKNTKSSYRAGSSYDVIRNNLVEFCGRDFNDAVGIYASFPDHLLIEHNEVRYLPYTGISLGWSWKKEETTHRNCEIRYNKIHDVCQTNSDGGAIYNLGTISGNGTHIHHNYAYNIYSPNGWAPDYPMAGLYCDGPGATNVLLDSNVVKNCECAFQNGSLTKKPNLKFYNNYWQCKKQWFDNGATKGSEAMEQGNIRIPNDTWPRDAIRIMEKAGIEDEYKDINNSTN